MLNTLINMCGYYKCVLNVLVHKQEAEGLKEGKCPGGKVGKRYEEKGRYEVPGRRIREEFSITDLERKAAADKLNKIPVENRLAGFISVPKFAGEEAHFCVNKRSISSKVRAGPKRKSTSEGRYAMQLMLI